MKKCNLSDGLSERLGTSSNDLDLLESLSSPELRERIKQHRETPRPGRPRKGEEPDPSQRTTRATFIVRERALEKIREISLREGIPQKEIISVLFETLISRYEEKNGEIIPTRRDASELLN